MPNWNHTLNVQSLWTSVNNDEITIGEFSTQVAEKIEKQFFPKYENELYDVVSELKDIKHIFADDGKESAMDEFNRIWGELYDWADGYDGKGNKNCWVKTSL